MQILGEVGGLGNLVMAAYMIGFMLQSAFGRFMPSVPAVQPLKYLERLSIRRSSLECHGLATSHNSTASCPSTLEEMIEADVISPVFDATDEV